MMLQSLCLVFCSTFIAVVLSTPVPRTTLPRIRVSTTGPYFLDEFNRTRLFHGTNSVNKGFPWYHPEMLDDRILDDLQSWGFNIIRLGSMWAGVEPSRGQYNETYINVLKTIVKKLADRGIYSMLDMHQDVLSSKFDGYDGVPLWLVDTYPEPSHPYPWPMTKIDHWVEGYFTQAVGESFEYFYNNYNGSVDKWAEFWGHLAKSFHGDPAMIGYNPMNEPWVGDLFGNPLLILPGISGKKHLVPAYDKIKESILKHDKEGIFFFEPMIHGQVGEDDYLGCGFDKVPGGPQHINTSSYNYHMYCWPLEFISKNATDGERQIAKEFCDDIFLPQKMNAQRANTQKFGGASIVTEFGECKTHGDRVDVECRTYMDLCDEYFVSWVQWEMFSFFNRSNNTHNMDVVRAHVRPYPQAIAGVPRNLVYNDATLDFMLEFTADSKIKAPTEIYVPSLRYKDGLVVEVSIGLKWVLTNDQKILVYNYEEVDTEPLSTIRIRAKK